MTTRRENMKGVFSFARHVIIVCAIVSLCSGCSSISVKHHAVGIIPPLCRTDAPKDRVVVYWGTAWRADQKEVSVREALAAESIAEFFGSNPHLCFETISVSKIIAGRDALLATDAEAISEAKATGADKVILIRIEELGPNLMLYLSPVLWQTMNEALLRVRSINTKTGLLEADVSTHWTRGGPFAVIGASSLPTDLTGALRAVFIGNNL